MKYQKVMTYTMVKKNLFRFPTERYLNIVKQGYKDCKLDLRYLKKALSTWKFCLFFIWNNYVKVLYE